MATGLISSICRESLLSLWLETDSSARSPYVIDGNPAMWKTLERDDGMTLYSRPARTIIKVVHGWVEVDGVGYQWQRNGSWYDQGCKTTFGRFLTMVETVSREDAPRIGMLGIFGPGAHFGAMSGFPVGTPVVIEEIHPERPDGRCTVRTAFGTTKAIANASAIVPLPEAVSIEEYFAEWAKRGMGEADGHKYVAAVLRSYRRALESGSIPDVGQLPRLRALPANSEDGIPEEAVSSGPSLGRR